ncbi:MAG: hypothetical protein WKF88_05635 [Ferruginibacter sp.]
MLYEGNQSPVKWFSDATARIIRQLLKRDRRKRLTLNLTMVRRQRGNTLLKKLYNQKSDTVTIAAQNETERI